MASKPFVITWISSSVSVWRGHDCSSLGSLVTAQVTLAPADQLWCTRRDQAVKLRMEDSGPASRTPITVHQMFLETVENYGGRTALAFKEDGQWVTMTYRQYYQQCRAAAKSFLKVCFFFFKNKEKKYLHFIVQ